VELGKNASRGRLPGHVPSEQRLTEWDVWAHKYDMIGLLTCYRFTGNPQALEISRPLRRSALRTFGDGPGQRNLLDAGYHTGMAPTSVLEPMALLYRFTAKKGISNSAGYILATWETPKGRKSSPRSSRRKRGQRSGTPKPTRCSPASTVCWNFIGLVFGDEQGP